MKELIKELRARTGAGVMDCKRALEQANLDIEKAIEYIEAKRREGLLLLEHRKHKEAKEGVIEAYVHHNRRVGVLLELNCETDFVARTDKFRELAKALALQVAACAPIYISKEAVPEEIIECEKENYKRRWEEIKGEAGGSSGGQAESLQEYVDNKLDEFYSRVCLLQQPFIKDETKKVYELLTQAISELGEHIEVRRFVRFALGESK